MLNILLTIYTLSLLVNALMYCIIFYSLGGVFLTKRVMTAMFIIGAIPIVNTILAIRMCIALFIPSNKEIDPNDVLKKAEEIDESLKKLFNKD